MLSRTPRAERRIMLHRRAIATRRSGGRSRRYAPTVEAVEVMSFPPATYANGRFYRVRTPRASVRSRPVENEVGGEVDPQELIQLRCLAARRWHTARRVNALHMADVLERAFTKT